MPCGHAVGLDQLSIVYEEMCNWYKGDLVMVMVMVMEILFHLGRPLAMRLLYKAPRTAQIQVTVGPVKEGGGEEKHTYNNSK